MSVRCQERPHVAQQGEPLASAREHLVGTRVVIGQPCLPQFFYGARGSRALAVGPPPVQAARPWFQYSCMLERVWLGSPVP